MEGREGRAVCSPAYFIPYSTLRSVFVLGGNLGGVFSVV